MAYREPDLVAADEPRPPRSCFVSATPTGHGNREGLLPSYWWSDAFSGGALIAAIAILLPTILHAQQGTPETIPPPPGISWEGPPAQAEWGPAQGGAAEGGAQDRSDAREQHDESTERRQEQDLITQQAMAEQARRMADFIFWQIVFGAAVLIGLGITIYYTRQTAHAAVSAVDLSRQAYLTEHRTRVQAHPIGAQRSHAAQPNQRDKIGPCQGRSGSLSRSRTATTNRSIRGRLTYLSGCEETACSW